MQQNDGHLIQPLNEHEQMEQQRRFPRAMYWFGARQEHPDIPAPVYQPPPYPPPQFYHGQPAHPFYPPFPAFYPVPPEGGRHAYQYPGANLPLAGYPPPPMAIPAGVAQPARAQARLPNAPTQLKVSIPLNTGVPGATVSRTELALPVALSWDDFNSRVCAHMNLNPQQARLGYKYHTDRSRDPPHRLSSEEELREAFSTGIGLVQRARSRVVVMEIHNLNPAMASNKRKTAHDRALGGLDQPSTTLSFLSELRELKGHLECSRHPGRHCYVSPINGDHIPLDIAKLTLWAKKMFLNEATLHQPPDVLGFDHVAKKPRRRASQMAPQLPAIHVHIPSVPVPLGDAAGQRRLNSQGGRMSASHPSSSMSVIDLTSDDTLDKGASPSPPAAVKAESPSPPVVVKVESPSPPVAVKVESPTITLSPVKSWATTRSSSETE